MIFRVFETPRDSKHARLLHFKKGREERLTDKQLALDNSLILKQLRNAIIELMDRSDLNSPFEAATNKANAKLGVEEGKTRQLSTDLVLTRYTVCINKMDKCGWSEGQFNEIKD
jgi:hypothetical protein